MDSLSPPTSPSHHHDARPRMSTTASYMSNRSRRSSNATSNKMDLVELSKDKKRLYTKADPSKALNEAQPAAVAQQESSLEDIRATRHKDYDGNVIIDPDRSNPTRNRFERPLDTIRAFNAAADGTTNRRSYQPRPPQGTGYGGPDNRRTSYYSNGNGNYPQQQRPRPGAGGYYRHNSYPMRPESYVEEPAPPQPPYGRIPRGQGQPYYTGEGSSPGHSYQQSYETMTSGSDDYGKSTNPSSQNSSFDRLHQMHGRKVDEFGQYDDIQPVQPPMNGYGHYPPHGGQNGNYNRQMPLAQRNGPLPPPPANNPRQPIKLTNSNSGPPPTRADLNKDLPQKRQSWIKRKLGRRDS